MTEDIKRSQEYILKGVEMCKKEEEKRLRAEAKKKRDEEAKRLKKANKLAKIEASAQKAAKTTAAAKHNTFGSISVKKGFTGKSVAGGGAKSSMKSSGRGK